MSDAQPIDPARFAHALESLPADALFSKVAELTNSIAHLHSSNQQMLPFAEEGDQDCKDAMFENLSVIGRMNERIELVKVEVQKRGLRWQEDEVKDVEAGKQEPVTDMVNGEGELVNGSTRPATQRDGTSTADRHTQSGSLTDDELRRRLQSIMPDDDGGVHL